ncbi:MAG: type II CAAX prenyl endopeptidase Rce1 family protein [Desulfobulbus sp.]|jgi:membrane protease YdiL (CAAX protease family)
MITNRQLLLPYALPYLAYVGLAALPESLLAQEHGYLIRLIVVPLLLVWAWRWYCPLRGPRSPWGSLAFGAVAGLAGLVLWLALLTPFVDPGNGEPWSEKGFILRLLSAGLVVPIFEELMMRGYIFRLALQWWEVRKSGDPEPLPTALDQRSINTVAPGAWSWPALLISTLVFTAGHLPAEWLASVAYGLLMGWLWIRRQDLLSCIAAHAVTNIALACFVRFTGAWHYW